MKRILFPVLAALAWTAAASAQDPASFLPAWQEGYFDIHQIATGKGEASFLVFPDGTTMVIDCGDMTGGKGGWTESRALPDSSKTPAQWVARYVDHFSPTPGRVDYFLLTHFHPDHMGSDYAMKEGPDGYRLSGVTELGEYETFGKIVDRGYPDYDIPTKAYLQKMKVMPDYLSFIRRQRKKGTKVEAFEVCSRKQFALKKSGTWPFEVTNVAGNCMVMTGRGWEKVRMYEEDPSRWDENLFSCVTLFRYGKFRYYSGGDIQGTRPRKATHQNHDYESFVVPFVAPVHVMKADHHGCPDSCNPYFMWRMSPDVVVFPAAHTGHPAASTVERIADDMYMGRRLMYTTTDAGRREMGEKAWSHIAGWGHIVVRVYDKGARFKVYVLDAESTDYHILSESEEFQSDRPLIQ